jgi:hypothetical protein
VLEHRAVAGHRDKHELFGVDKTALHLVGFDLELP